MTTDTATLCGRVWRQYPRGEDLTVHICHLTANHPGHGHRCECGDLKTLTPHPNQGAR